MPPCSRYIPGRCSEGSGTRRQASGPGPSAFQLIASLIGLKHFVPEPEFAWLGVENCARYAAATDGSRHALTAKAPRFLAAINTRQGLRVQ